MKHGLNKDQERFGHCPHPCFIRVSSVAVILLLSSQLAIAQLPQAPQYADCRLDSIFPNGGQQGTTVTVTFRG